MDHCARTVHAVVSEWGIFYCDIYRFSDHEWSSARGQCTSVHDVVMIATHDINNLHNTLS
jgi:hypothetical protein